YVGQHRAKPIEPTAQRLLVVARPAQCMIAREVMSYVWYQNLQHLVVVVILDIGETLAHEFLDKVAVDHCFAPYALTSFVSGLIPFVHISSSSFSLAHPRRMVSRQHPRPSLSFKFPLKLFDRTPWSSHSRPSRVCWEGTL